MALAEGDSIVYLTAQHLEPPHSGARLGAIGHGPNGPSLAERLCRHLETWEADRAAKPIITIYASPELCCPGQAAQCRPSRSRSR